MKSTTHNSQSVQSVMAASRPDSQILRVCFLVFLVSLVFLVFLVFQRICKVLTVSAALPYVDTKTTLLTTVNQINYSQQSIGAVSHGSQSARQPDIEDFGFRCFSFCLYLCDFHRLCKVRTLSAALP